MTSLAPQRSLQTRIWSARTLLGARGAQNGPSKSGASARRSDFRKKILPHRRAIERLPSFASACEARLRRSARLSRVAGPDRWSGAVARPATVAKELATAADGRNRRPRQWQHPAHSKAGGSAAWDRAVGMNWGRILGEHDAAADVMNPTPIGCFALAMPPWSASVWAPC